MKSLYTRIVKLNKERKILMDEVDTRLNNCNPNIYKALRHMEKTSDDCNFEIIGDFDISKYEGVLEMLYVRDDLTTTRKQVPRSISIETPKIRDTLVDLKSSITKKKKHNTTYNEKTFKKLECLIENELFNKFEM